MRELVIVLHRRSCLDYLLQNCAVAERHDCSSACTAKCILPVGLEKDAKLDKLPSNTHAHHDDLVIRFDPAIPGTTLNLQNVDVDGVKSELVRVTVTRDPKLDRSALNYGPSNNSTRRRGSRASIRNDQEDAMLVKKITKERFLSQLSLSPYHVGLRTRKSSQKRLETSALRSESLDLWKQIRAERNVGQNPISRRVRVILKRNGAIDRLALQPGPQSFCLNSFELSKTRNFKTRLKTMPKVVLKRNARLDQFAAECASVPPRSQCVRADQMCIQRSDTVLPISPSQNEREQQAKDVNVVIDQNSPREQPRTDDQQVVQCNMSLDCSRRHSDSDLISFEPPAKSQRLLHTQSNTSPVNITKNTAEISGNTKGKASPVSITAAARTIKLVERRSSDTGLTTSHSEPPRDYPSTKAKTNPTKAKTNPSVDIIKLKRITGDNWALLPSFPNAPVFVSSNPTGTGSEAGTRTAFIKLNRDSAIDRLAFKDSKSTARQPPSQLIPGSTLPVLSSCFSVSGSESSRASRSKTNNEWPKLTVDAEIHHNENENPRKHSIPPSRGIRKRLSIMGNSRKNKHRKFACRKNRLISYEVANNSISQHMAVKKPLRVRSDLDSINIDPPNTGG